MFFVDGEATPRLTIPALKTIFSVPGTLELMHSLTVSMERP